MNEDPLRTIALIPESLVMRVTSCFYCGANFDGDYYIKHAFGIRHCKEHASWAERDCKAYLHDIDRVPTYFAIRDSDIRDLVNMIDIYGVTIQRSNGEFESDWCFNNGSIFNPFYIIKQDNESWSIPLINKSKTAIKNVLLKDFTKSEFRQHNKHLSEIFYKNLDCVVNKLEEGLYKKEHEEHLIAFKNTDVTYAPEGVNIHKYRSDTGEVIRVLVT